MGFLDLIGIGNGNAVAKQLRNRLDAAREVRERATHEYDKMSAKRRRYYLGHQKQDLRKELLRRYPNTGAKLPTRTLNVVRKYAADVATVFANGASIETVRPEEAERERTQEDLIAQLFENSRAWSTLADAERELQVARSVYIRLTFNEYRQRIGLEAHWPGENGISYIPHPVNTADIQQSPCVLVRIAPQQDAPTYDVWSRESTDQPWRVQRVDTKGRVYEVPGVENGVYPLRRLPIIAWNLGMPVGTTVMPLDEDLTGAQDDLNWNMSNKQYLIDLEAHTVVVYEGQDMASNVIGPGEVLQHKEEERYYTLGLDPKLDELEAHIDQNLRMFAVANRLNPDSYTATDGQNVLSGVALRIINEPLRKAREEQTVFADDMMADLVPAMIEMSDAYLGTSIGEETAWRWHPAEQPEFVAESERQEQVFALVDRGYLTDAQAATQLGVFETLKDAMDAGLSNELSAAPTPEVQQTPFAERLAQAEAAQGTAGAP